MPTAPALVIALGILASVGMLPDAHDQQAAEQRARSWVTVLDPTVTDGVLGDAVRLLASGEVETYGDVKPADLNRAAKTVRSRRVKAWLERNAVPTERRTAFEQSAYSRGFLRAIGDGADAIEADRHGRAAAAQASAVATSEPGTPLPELLARMDTALAEGRVPWAGSLPPARPEITTTSDTGGGEPGQRLRVIMGGLTEGSVA